MDYKMQHEIHEWINIMSYKIVIIQFFKNRNKCYGMLIYIAKKEAVKQCIFI